MLKFQVLNWDSFVEPLGCLKDQTHFIFTMMAFTIICGKRHYQKMWRFNSEISSSPLDISCRSASVLTSQWILVFPFKNSDRQRKSKWWMSMDMDSLAMHYCHKHSYSWPQKVLVHACIPVHYSFRLVWYGVIREYELLTHWVRCVTTKLTWQKKLVERFNIFLFTIC